MNFILIITGTSTVGKTTLYESLRTNPTFKDKSIEFHDMDERGDVPQAGRGPWRAYRAQELLHNAATAFATGSSSILCGNIKPHEIIESEYFSADLNIHFLCLTLPSKVIRERTLKRAQENTDKNIDDSSFSPENAEQALVSILHFARITEVSTRNQAKGHVLDTSNLSPAEMHDKVIKLIQVLNTL